MLQRSSQQSRVYLDDYATTPVDPRVADRVYHFMTTEFGNASSVDHQWGDCAEAAVKQAAKQVADLIGASPREIIRNPDGIVTVFSYVLPPVKKSMLTNKLQYQFDSIRIH